MECASCFLGRCHHCTVCDLLICSTLASYSEIQLEGWESSQQKDLMVDREANEHGLSEDPSICAEIEQIRNDIKVLEVLGYSVD
jgi:hypothetical protein